MENEERDWSRIRYERVRNGTKYTSRGPEESQGGRTAGVRRGPLNRK